MHLRHPHRLAACAAVAAVVVVALAGAFAFPSAGAGAGAGADCSRGPACTWVATWAAAPMAAAPARPGRPG